jgi:hypothetical protein
VARGLEEVWNSALHQRRWIIEVAATAWTIGVWLPVGTEMFLFAFIFLILWMDSARGRTDYYRRMLAVLLCDVSKELMHVRLCMNMLSVWAQCSVVTHWTRLKLEEHRINTKIKVFMRRVKHWGMSHSDFVSIALERCDLAEDGRRSWAACSRYWMATHQLLFSAPVYILSIHQ